MRPIVIVHEAPLHAGGEARAAATAQTGVFDYGGHFFRFHAGNSTLEGCEPAIALIDRDGVDIGDIAMAQQDVSHDCTSLYPSINSSVDSTVMFS